MLKLLPPGDREMRLVKVSERGLIGNDRREFLKIASHDFVRALEKIALHPGEVPVWLTALGCTEVWGPNRNGDGFKRAMCVKCHPTFEKYAHVYRDHINRDPNRSYGRVLKSAYNEAMDRVELLVGLNGTEKVARLNRGLLADREMQKIASGDEIAWSMACSLPFDVCSSCGNQARNRDEYCDESSCTRLGLRHNMAKVASDGHIMHADNPNPRFFDISHVFRPADRTAFSFGVLQKAAGAGTAGGAELAELAGLSLPPLVLAADHPGAESQYKVACHLAGLEAESFFSVVPPADPVPALPGSTGEVRVKQALRSMADNGIVLDLQQFVSFVSGDPEGAAELAQERRTKLAGIFTRLLGSGSFIEKLATNPFVPGDRGAPDLDRWAVSIKHSHSLLPDAVRGRSMRAAIRKEASALKLFVPPSGAAIVGDEDPILVSYALYKVAALTAIGQSHPEFQEIAAFSVQQHHVI